MIKLKELIPENYLGIVTRKSIIGRPSQRSVFVKSVNEQEEEKKEDKPENKEIDLYALVTDPTNNITKETKKAFVEAVRRYNEYSKSIYREHNLKEISKNIVTLCKLAEKIALNEADDWFDSMTIKRDMKSLADSAKMFEITCKEMSQLQHRLESLYEECEAKLSKYFQIDDK